MPDDLRKLAEAATPGPWESVPGARVRIERTIITKGRLAVAVHVNPPDATYIAAAHPQAVLALLDELDRLREENEERHRAFKRMRGQRAKARNALRDMVDLHDPNGAWREGGGPEGFPEAVAMRLGAARDALRGHE